MDPDELPNMDVTGFHWVMEHWNGIKFFADEDNVFVELHEKTQPVPDLNIRRV
jgi:hypothetical protein